MGSFGLPKDMTYPGGVENSGRVEEENTDPAMPGPRVMELAKSETTAGASITEGFGYKEEIHGVTPEEIGASTIGGGQVHMQHPKNPAGRGTRFG